MNLKRLVFSFPVFIFSFFAFSLFLNVPNANAACSRNPTWQILDYTDGVRSVTYHLRLINNCSGTNNFRVMVSQLPTNPQTLNADWRVNDEALNEVQVLSVSGSRNIDIKVIRDLNYYHPDGVYSPVTFRAALDSNTSINDHISSNYIVVNRPDLEIKVFDYPGGLSCERSNPTVRIRNQGWVAITQNFSVYVQNGANAGKLREVSQRVDHNEVIDLSGFFSDMALPPPGTYTANAEVDVYGQISEENERDNDASSSYSTAPCSPIGSHDASDCNASWGWACDPDKYSQSLKVHLYEGGSFLGEVTANQSRPDVPAAGYCGGNSNVGFSFITPESLKDGNPHTITTYAINIGSGNDNPALPGTPKTITCAPPFTISGGVFLDSIIENGIKDPGENYIGGTITIPGVSNISYPNGGFVANVITGTYTVSATSIPEGHEFTYPKALFPPPPNPSVRVSVGSSTCDNGTHAYARCDGAGNVYNVNIGIRLTPADPWINGKGGDMRVDNGMKNAVQENNYFSEVNTDNPVMDHGVVFGTGLTLNDDGLDSAKANESNWLVTDTRFSFPIVRTSYDEIRRSLYKIGILSNALSVFGDACPGSGPSCKLEPNITNAVYTTDAKVVLESTSENYTFPVNKNFVFLIEDDLEIKTDIIVPKGSTVTFIVKGNITVAASVKRIEGIFSTDNNFVTEGVSTGIDTQLIIAGSVIANAKLNQNFGRTPGTFENNRNLDRLNDTTPAVEIIYRPDFVLNAPGILRYRSYTISEVAPGS